MHNDFQFRNVLVADSALSEGPDFDKVGASDPARDFSMLYAGDVAQVRDR